MGTPSTNPKLKALLDANGLIGALNKLDSTHQDAYAVWQAIERGDIEAYASAISIQTLYYVIERDVRRVHGAAVAQAEALAAVQACLATVKIIPADARLWQIATTLVIDDLEDAMQRATAGEAGVSVIITSDKKFKSPDYTLVTPAGVLLLL